MRGCTLVCTGVRLCVWVCALVCAGVLSNNYEFSEYLLETKVFMKWPLVRILYEFFIMFFDVLFSSSSINCDGWIWSRALGSILQSWIEFGSYVSSGSSTGSAFAGYYRMETRQAQVVKIKFYVWTKVIIDHLFLYCSVIMLFELKRSKTILFCKYVL